MNTPTVKLISVSRLEPLSQLAEHFPTRTEGESNALTAIISEAGKLPEPLTVLADEKTVYIGQSSLLIAKKLFAEGREEFESVPCLIMPSADPLLEACLRFLTRRHATGTQRAFTAFNLYRDNILGRAGTKGGRANSKNLELSVDAIAKRTNTSDTYLLGFAALWKDFESKWDQVFQLVWRGGETGDGPVALNHLRPALMGKETGGSGDRQMVLAFDIETNSISGCLPDAIDNLVGNIRRAKTSLQDLPPQGCTALGLKFAEAIQQLPPLTQQTISTTMGAQSPGKKAVSRG